jgi:hypothetical protein
MNRPAKAAARSEGERQGPLATALALAVLGLVGSAAVGWLSYRSAREHGLKSLSVGHLRLARALAAHADRADRETVAGTLVEIEALWSHSQDGASGTFLCAVGPDGVLALHTRHPSLVGTSVGDIPLAPPGGEASVTIGDLLRRGEDWVGLHRDLDGTRQLGAYAYSPGLGGLVVVHVAQEHLQREIRRRALPWLLGLGGVAALFVIALATLGRSYAQQRRRLTETLGELRESRRLYLDL